MLRGSSWHQTISACLKRAELGHQRLDRERIELLDAQQIDVVDAALLALLVEVVIDLAGAQHDAADLVVGDELDLLVGQQLRVVPQQPVERGAGPISSSRDTARLWRSSDFGVIRISGLRMSRLSWRRRMWK